MSNIFKTCEKCGENIRFIRMVNSGRWSSSTPGANKCSHRPLKQEEN